MTRRRTWMTLATLLVGTSAVGETLAPAQVDDAVARIRAVLPPEWHVARVEPATVPFGWSGDPECALVRLEDDSFAYRHEDQEFQYNPFYKLWLLPPAWEGRMEVAVIEPSAPQAVYLGENDELRVLYRSLGSSSWPAGPKMLAETLDLHEFRLTHSPKHSLDIDAMQVLFRRLDGVTGSISRWQQQIYGIAELPELIYLELLTWEDRGAASTSDPTFLGSSAEKETRFLTREVLAAFPKKRGIYLRRVTQAKFSDVLVVNPANLDPNP